MPEKKPTRTADLDYFYGQSSELFSFYRIPKLLFQDSRFQPLSTDAKTLYGILLDRMSLSARNGWLDKAGRVFIIYTVQEVQDSLGCADKKATTCENLGIGLAMEGKKVLLVDADPQRSLTIVASLLWLVVRTACRFIFARHADIAIIMGWQQPDELPTILSTLMQKAMDDQSIPPGEGILLTMTDSRTNYGQQIDTLIRGAYGSKIKVFDQTIPRSVRATEISAVGKSIFQHDPKGKVAEAYQSLTKEVMANAEKQLKRVAERGR